MQKEENVKVAVRVRPNYYESEEEKIIEIIEANCVRLKGKEPVDHKYDKVFDCDSSQDEIFNFTKPIIDGFVEGYNGTIFAYGQTGSGKTFTMFGKDNGNGLSEDFYQSENRGLIPRAMEYLFNQLDFNKHEKESFKWTLKCNFIELYMEKFYDLLEQGDHTLKLRTIGDKTVIEGATEKIIEYPNDVFQVILDGWSQRTTAQTRMNERSSRSHAIFILELDTSEMESDGMMKKRNSRLNLVDLAGSERQKDTHTEGTRFEEGKKINLSLLTLGKVIRAISRSGISHIPYRDSMLTQLLKDSLGGNAQTMTIVNVHPNKRCVIETRSSLHFAHELKQVVNHVQKNEALSSEKIDAYNHRIALLESEMQKDKALIEELRKELESLSDKATKFEKRAAQYEKFANAKEADALSWKTKLKLKGESLRLLNERLKSSGDSEQLQKLQEYYENQCENVIGEALKDFKERPFVNTIAVNDLDLEMQFRNVCMEKDKIKEELNVSKQEKAELEQKYKEKIEILQKTIDTLNSDLSEKRHEVMEMSFLGTPNYRRMSMVPGLPKTPEDDKGGEMCRREKKERRKTNFDSATARKSTAFMPARNLFNVPEVEEPEHEEAHIDANETMNVSLQQLQPFTELEEKVQMLEATNRDLQMENLEKQKYIEELQKKETEQINEICAKKAKVEQELSHSKESLVSVREKLAEVEKEHMNCADNASMYQKTATSLKAKISTYEKMILENREEVQRLNEQLLKDGERRNALQQELEELKQNLEDEKTKFNQKTEETSKSSKCLQKSLEQVMNENRTKQKELEELKQRYDQVLKENSELAGHSNPKQKITYINNLREQIREKDEEISMLRTENSKLKMVDVNSSQETPFIDGFHKVRHSERIARSKENKPQKK